MATSAPIIDLYAPLNHKAPMGSGSPRIRTNTWVPKAHQRRLIAYQLLDAYSKNNASHYRSDANERMDLREYGDADALVEAIQSALIGDSQVISIPEAEAYEADFADKDNPTPQERAIQDLAERATDRLRLLENWAERERLLIKIPGAERKAVRLGDTLYVLTWSSKARRPRLRTYDPACYFPVLDDDGEEFPNKVHLAWEIESEHDPNKKRVRRITFELKDIEPIIPTQEIGLGGDDPPTVGWPEGVRYDERTGLASVQLPWNNPQEPATQMCYLSDGTWEIDSSKPGIDDFDENRATWALNADGRFIRNLPLGIDFMPVVHVPNTEEDEQHFGSSALLRVCQLLDDLAMDDSDLVKTAGTSAFPVMAFEGGEGPESDDEGQVTGTWGPGSYAHNPNGRIHMMSTENALEPLAMLGDRLLERLAVNSRVPASAMGRTDPNGQESGIQLALSWGPLRSMISQMRLARQEKYALILKFVQRFYQLASVQAGPLKGLVPAGPEQIFSAQIVFGSYLPTDRPAAVKEISDLFNSKLISRRTAIGMLIELGLPIDDADKELRRIEQEDYEGAAMLLEASGSPDAVANLLGVPVASVVPETPEF